MPINVMSLGISGVYTALKSVTVSASAEIQEVIKYGTVVGSEVNGEWPLFAEVGIRSEEMDAIHTMGDVVNSSIGIETDGEATESTYTYNQSKSTFRVLNSPLMIQGEVGLSDG